VISNALYTEYLEPDLGVPVILHLQKDTATFNLTFAHGYSSFGFRHRHGYGTTVTIDVHLTTKAPDASSETVQPVQKFTTDGANPDTWNTVAAPIGEVISSATAVFKGNSPSALVSMTILAFSMIELLFDLQPRASPASVYFPSERDAHVQKGSTACSLDFAFTKPLVDGTYKVFVTGNPYVLVSTHFAIADLGWPVGELAASAGESAGDLQSLTIYNGVNGWIDPSFYFGASESVFVLPGFARVHSAL